MEGNHNQIDISLMVNERPDEESKSMNSSQGISNSNFTGGPSTIPDTHAENHVLNDRESFLESFWIQQEQKYQKYLKRATIIAIIINIFSLVLLPSPVEIFFSFSSKDRLSSGSGSYAVLLSSIDSITVFTIISVLIIGYMERDWEMNGRIQIFTYSFLIVNLIDIIVFVLVLINGYTKILTLLTYIARGLIFSLNFLVIRFAFKLQKLYSVVEEDQYQF